MKGQRALIWLLAFTLEAGAARLLLEQRAVWIAAAVTLHVVASAIFGFSLLSSVNGGHAWAWALLGWTLPLLAFPIVGMLAVAVAVVLAATVFRRPAMARPRPEDIELERRARDPVARAHEVEVGLLDELEIEPVVDVIREDDPDLKRAAIEAVAKHGGPASVRILRGLLHDPSPESRFFASIGLSKLEDEIGRSILRAQRAVAETPDSSEAREHLAQLYLDYAISGFPEGVTRDYYLELAHQAFEEALPVSPDPDPLARRQARVALLLGNIGEAAALLDGLAARHPNDADIRLLRMEAIYQSGDFQELVLYARGSKPRVSDEFEGRELVEWWAHAGEVATPVAG